MRAASWQPWNPDSQPTTSIRNCNAFGSHDAYELVRGGAFRILGGTPRFETRRLYRWPWVVSKPRYVPARGSFSCASDFAGCTNTIPAWQKSHYAPWLLRLYLTGFACSSRLESSEQAFRPPAHAMLQPRIATRIASVITPRRFGPLRCRRLPRHLPFPVWLRDHRVSGSSRRASPSPPH